MASSHLNPALEAARRVLEALPVRKGTGEHERFCPVCKLSDPVRRELERGFVRWVDPMELAKRSGVGVQAIRRHAERYDLDLMRADCHVLALGRILEKGLSGDAPRSAFQAVMKALTDISPPPRSSVATPADGEPGDEPDTPTKPSRTSWEQAVRDKAARGSGNRTH